MNGPVCIFGDLNSRIYRRCAAEEDHIGEYYYKADCINLHAKLNRFLLAEILQRHDLQLANSYFEHSLTETITYRDLGVHLHKISEANPNRLAQLDVALVPKKWMHKVKDGKIVPNASLATQHYSILAVLELEIQMKDEDRGPKRTQVNSLRDAEL